MKNLIAAQKWFGLFCATSLMLFLLPQIFAQSWLPKCPDILKLEPKEFVLMYVQNNIYRSDVRPESEIILIWTNCQRRANDTKLKNNPKLKARMSSLKAFETTFFDAQFTFGLIGGGYSSATGQAGSVIQEQQDFFEPYLERHFGVVIGLALSKSGAVTSSSISARHAKAVRILEADIKQKSLGATQNVDAETIKNLPPDLSNNYVQNWENSALQTRGAYSDIYKLVGQPVDLTSTTILEFLAKSYYTK
jgi:hypothetical protein